MPAQSQLDEKSPAKKEQVLMSSFEAACFEIPEGNNHSSSGKESEAELSEMEADKIIQVRYGLHSPTQRMKEEVDQLRNFFSNIKMATDRVSKLEAAILKSPEKLAQANASEFALSR